MERDIKTRRKHQMPSNRQSNIIGYGMITALVVILWEPFLGYMNTNLPVGTIGDALSSFFWIIYPVTVIWLIGKTITAFF